MELSSILAGLEYMGECYPDMFYANTNPTGMNNIALCLNNIRCIVRQHGEECPEVSFYAQRNNQLIMAAYEQKWRFVKIWAYFWLKNDRLHPTKTTSSDFCHWQITTN